jgi:hypothetical protein
MVEVDTRCPDLALQKTFCLRSIIWQYLVFGIKVTVSPEAEVKILRA